jgi:hypothetical protein
MVLFPLKLGMVENMSLRKPPRDPLSCLLPPYNPETLASQAEFQDKDWESSPELPEAQPKLTFDLPKWVPVSFSRNFRSWFVFLGAQKGTPTMSKGYSEVSPFPHHPKCSHRTFTHLERSQLEVETDFVDALLTSTEVWNLKKELKPLFEDPYAVADQLDQFLGPQIYT